MKTISLSAFSGALLVSVWVVFDDGPGSGMFLAGFLAALFLLITLLCSFGAKRAGRFLLSFSDALKRHNTRDSPKLSVGQVVIEPTTLEDDVQNALICLGTPRKKARECASEAARQGEEFDVCFRRAVELARAK